MLATASLNTVLFTMFRTLMAPEPFTPRVLNDYSTDFPRKFVVHVSSFPAINLQPFFADSFPRLLRLTIPSLPPSDPSYLSLEYSHCPRGPTFGNSHSIPLDAWTSTYYKLWVSNARFRRLVQLSSYRSTNELFLQPYVSV